MMLLNNPRTFLALIHDIFVVIIAWYGAFLLRFNFEIPPEYFLFMLKMYLIVIPIRISMFIFSGLYRGTWRFASVTDLRRIIITVLLSSVLIAILQFLFTSNYQIPRSVIILDPILLVLLMGGSRLAYRLFKEFKFFSGNGKPVVIFGSGDSAISLIKSLSKNPEWEIVGLIDDDKAMYGREILNIKVFGGLETLPLLITRFDVKNIIIAKSSWSYKLLHNTLEKSKKHGLDILTIPSVEDLIRGRVNISEFRNINVEDLLGRDVVDLDSTGLRKLVSKKTVMVSGAGGSIGSELCVQILKFKPLMIVCLDISESALYELEQKINITSRNTKLVFLVGDVKNELRIKKILDDHNPNLVFHAAAYKHVPMMENNNISEAFSNNVYGTYILANACKKSKIDKFILISTDKAVNPTNVMGATKRLAEMACQAIQENTGTKFIIVRFGNVLGSSGSVIPKFRTQIDNGGPLTVTHPEITRYFMSIPEAAQLVMQASLMGIGGQVYLLDMGDPIRIVDLAKDMIRLSGLTEGDIKIKFTGLRPGEKLYEELLIASEKSLPTKHKKLYIASTDSVSKSWLLSLFDWMKTIPNKSDQTIKKELKKWVKEYQPK
jgi:FlaA1/EpsC-like NDP-sugar epimerase